VGISTVKVSFRPSFQLAQRSPMILLNNIAIVNQQKSFISVYNPTSHFYTIPKGLILGTTTVPTLSFRMCTSINHQLTCGAKVMEIMSSMVRPCSGPLIESNFFLMERATFELQIMERACFL